VIDQAVEKPSPVTGHPSPSIWYILLQFLAMGLLTVGFSAPWIYGAIGKSSDYGWQPVISALTFIIPLFFVVVGAIVSCYTYLEMMLKMGQPVLRGILRWGGVFFLMVLILPLVLWLTLDLTGRSQTPQTRIDSLGWGVWVTLAGLILQVLILRLRIRQLDHARA
jgi:hypothetical protein